MKSAVDVLHRDEVDAVHVVDIVYGDDVRVVERRGGSRFVHEAPPALGIGNGVRRQHLDCNDAVQMRVAGLVHDAHAALAQFFEHGIMRKRSASYHGKSKCILAAGAMSRDGSTGA